VEAARPAVAADVPEIARLVRLARDAMTAERGGALWLAAEGQGQFDVTSIGDVVSRPGHHLSVGTLDGSVVGYLYADTVPLAGRSGPLAVIRELYVEPDGREVGIGEALMDGVLAWARAQGCAGIDSFALPGNRALKNLFERYGLVARAILVHRPLGGDP
jgi:GNAT superfamily N-acetyltransferase